MRMRYVLRGGIAWRALPHDYPPWQTVYHYLPRCGGWMGPGNGSTTNCASWCGSAPGALPAAECGHPGQPIGADHGKGGPRGYDGAKKLSGRKRHLLVDTVGLLLRAVVHAGRRQRPRRGASWCWPGIAERAPDAAPPVGRCRLSRADGDLDRTGASG